MINYLKKMEAELISAVSEYPQFTVPGTYNHLGDTYRLDMYKSNLNDNTYEKMKSAINDNINTYLQFGG